MSTFPQAALSQSSQTEIQGEKSVGNATVQLVASATPCNGVRIMAPSVNSTKGAQNIGNILVGFGATTPLNKSGGITLEKDDYLGVFIPVGDASRVCLTGFNAGDAVEYQIYR